MSQENDRAPELDEIDPVDPTDQTDQTGEAESPGQTAEQKPTNSKALSRRVVALLAAVSALVVLGIVVIVAVVIVAVAIGVGGSDDEDPTDKGGTPGTSQQMPADKGAGKSSGSADGAAKEAPGKRAGEQPGISPDDPSVGKDHGLPDPDQKHRLDPEQAPFDESEQIITGP